MKTSLLTALRDFRPREGHDPLENFITEAFAWLLINHEGFSRFYLAKVGQRLGLAADHQTTSAEWTTRMNLGGVFPDLVGIAGKITYLFEHKAWSHLHLNQLRNYRAAADQANGVGSHHLILVTAGRHQFDQDPDLALCWHEVHQWITDWIAHKEYSPSPIFADFQALLENEGMGPPAPVSHEAILAYKPAQTFEPGLVSLVQRAVHHRWKDSFPLAAPDPKLPWHRSLPGGKDPWGRIGINLAGEIDRSPHGCFLGFLVDPTDHCVEWQIPGSPDFSIILGANPTLCPNYYESENFRSLMEALPVALELNCPEFQFLDHFGTCDDPNRWHPIHVRMPIVELFRGTATADEQYQRFIDYSSRALSCIENLPEFRAFLNSIQPSPLLSYDTGGCSESEREIVEAREALNHD